MRRRAGGLDKRRSLPEIGISAGGRDHRSHFAHLGNGAGISGIADGLVDRQRLAGQGRLINAQIFTLDQLDIRRNDISETQENNITGHQLGRRNTAPDPVAQDSRLERQFFLERGNGIVGLEFFPESDAGIDQEHDGDDREIFPMPNHRRQHRGNLDHPWNRPPEIGQKFHDGLGAAFGKLVRTEDIQAATRFGFTEAGRQIGGKRVVSCYLRNGPGWASVLHRLALRHQVPATCHSRTRVLRAPDAETASLGK